MKTLNIISPVGTSIRGVQKFNWSYRTFFRAMAVILILLPAIMLSSCIFPGHGRGGPGEMHERYGNSQGHGHDQGHGHKDDRH